MDQLEFYIARQIDEVGNHSALLMYILGNELNYIGSESTWMWVLNRINSLAGYAREYQVTKWNRTVPITTGTDDNGDLYATLMDNLPNMDFLTANAGYRGVNFTNLWSGWGPGSVFPGWWNMSCYYQKPLLIGEMNPLGYDDPPTGTYLPTGFNEQWWDLLNHVSEGAIGGIFFEWEDELWKAFGNQSELGLVSPSVACNSTGACSTDPDVWLADTITDSGWLYQSVCCGSYDGGDYNFQTDPFKLLGRSPAQLSSVSQPDCPFTYTSTPPPMETVVGTGTTGGRPPSSSAASSLKLSTLVVVPLLAALLWLLIYW